MSRRAFLEGVIKAFFVAAASVLAAAAIYLYPGAVRRKTLRFVPALREEDLPLRGVRRVEITYEHQGRKIVSRAFVAALPEGYVAFSPVCTHLGCLVNWDGNKGEFLCPCHGGRYDMQGRVVAGPPPGPLTRLPLELRDGVAFIGIGA